MSRSASRLALIAVIVFLGTSILTVPAAASSEWTAMFYIDGDNNLEYYGKVEMSEVNDSVAETVALVLKDDADDGDTRLYHVLNGTTTELSPDWLDSEMNMGDGDTLFEFVNWSLANYPSNKTFITLWDHGGAFVGCCADDTDGHDMLTMSEIRTALSGALGEDERIDVIGFADCLMANTEVAYELRDVGSYMVGSEKVGWAYGSEAINWDMDDIIECMDDNDDPADVASFVVSNGMDLLSGMKYQSHTWSAINLTNMTGLLDDLDDLSAAMDDAFPDRYLEIMSAREATESYQGPYGGQYDRIVDLYHFAENLLAFTTLPSEVLDAAAAVMDELNVTVIAEGHHTALLDNDEPCDHAHGLSINFPDVRAKMWYYYTHSTRGPAEFVSDSDWDEFLSLYGSYLFVDDDGSGTGDGSAVDPYDSVQEAVDAALAGDTVRIMDGTYDESVIVNVSISIVGNGTGNTVVMGDGGDVFSIIADSTLVSRLTVVDAASGYAGIAVSSDDVVLTMLNASGNPVGVVVDTSLNCTITFCNVSGNGVGVLIERAYPGTHIDNTSFRNNQFNINNTGTSDVDAEYNFWGTVDEADIRDAIHDGCDDISLGTVDYAPWYGSDLSSVHHADVAAPTTTSDHDDAWHRSDITFNLTALDSGTGVEETFFRIVPGAWQTGTAVVVPAPADHSMDGIVTVEFRSVDRVGNNGTIVAITVRIDTTAPELRIWYDVSRDRVRFHPADLLDDSPVKKTRRSGSLRTFILTDHAGNVAKVKLLYTKSVRDDWSIRKVVLTKVRHNDGAWHYFRAGERYALRTLTESRSLSGLEQISRGSNWQFSAIYAGATDSTRVTVSDGGWSTSTVSGVCCADMFVSGNAATYSLS